MLYLSGLFFATAILYASVGFGGGSTYNALLVIGGTDYRILPSIALICNIIVVAGGFWRFGRAGHISSSRLVPYLLASVPAAWLGGRAPISETMFVGLLGFSLLLAGLRLLIERRPATEDYSPRIGNDWPAGLVCGALIGFLSGMVGIGGGIFLAPLLYLRRWGTSLQISGASTVFILCNSVSGLFGQMSKSGAVPTLLALEHYWLLFPAVLLGGQLGSYFGSSRFSASLVKRLTSILIIYAGLRLLLRWWSLMLQAGTASPV